MSTETITITLTVQNAPVLTDAIALALRQYDHLAEKAFDAGRHIRAEEYEAAYRATRDLSGDLRDQIDAALNEIDDS